MAHRLKHDSVLGTPSNCPSRAGDGFIRAGDHEIKSRPSGTAQLTWEELGVDVADRCPPASHRRRVRPEASRGQARRRSSSRRPHDPDLTIVLGVTIASLQPGAKHQLIRNASCTHEMRRPLAKHDHEAYTIERGLHDDDPRLHERSAQRLDRRTRLRRGPALAAINLIPTSTGAAAARIGGSSFRNLERARSTRMSCGRPSDGLDRSNPSRTGGWESENEPPLRGDRVVSIDRADTGELVGIRILRTSTSSRTDIHPIVATRRFRQRADEVKGKPRQGLGWYDNEWGYRCRIVDLRSRR